MIGWWRSMILAVIAASSGTWTASAQTIVRPPSPRSAATVLGRTTVRNFTLAPQGRVTAGPDLPDYRFFGYGTNYGTATAGASAYASYRGFPRYGYSSTYGASTYGYGAFGAYYGYPGYNLIGPTYAYRGYQGSYYGPGFTPNAGYGSGYGSRGYGAFAPLGTR